MIIISFSSMDGEREGKNKVMIGKALLISYQKIMDDDVEKRIVCQMFSLLLPCTG